MATTVQSTYNLAPPVAFAGMLADVGNNDVVTAKNKESTASMPFGFAVCFEGSTDDKGALNPDATTDKIMGITVHSHAYADTALGLGTAGAGTAVKGVLPGNTTNVLRKGRAYVIAEEAVVPGDRLFIRVVATGAEVEGALRKSADASDCIDSSSQGVWLSTASAGGLAVLEVDFTNKP